MRSGHNKKTEVVVSKRETPGFGLDPLASLLERFQFPGVDLAAILESQRKNVEALTRATQLAAEGATAVSQKQAEILREAMQQAVAVMRDFRTSGSPADIARIQQDLFRKALETGIANARELAEMVSRSNREAFSVIEHRMQESMADIREAAHGADAA